MRRAHWVLGNVITKPLDEGLMVRDLDDGNFHDQSARILTAREGSGPERLARHNDRLCLADAGTGLGNFTLLRVLNGQNRSRCSGCWLDELPIGGGDIPPDPRTAAPERGPSWLKKTNMEIRTDERQNTQRGKHATAQ